MKQKYFNVNASVVNIYSDPDFKSAVVTQGLLGESCVIMDSRVIGLMLISGMVIAVGYTNIKVF